MLLVGGDSFAEFPSDPQHEGKGLGVHFLHWAQIISNSNAKATGRGGYDLGFSSLETLSELYKNNYSHCIFFITDFLRTSQQLVNDNLAILNKLSTGHLTTDEFYSNTITDPSTVATGRYESLQPVNDLSFSSLGIMKPITDDNKIHNYLKLQPDFEYMHTRLGYISLLKNYCNNNNIKILFVCPFMNDERINDIQKFLQINVFDIFPNGKTELFGSESFKNNISHFNEEQHIELAERFSKEYPDWI